MLAWRRCSIGLGCLMQLSASPRHSAVASQQPGQVCRHQATGQVDVNQTRAWQAFRQSADPSAMRPVAGVWELVQSHPQTGAVSRQHWTYEASGLVQYSDQICGSMPGLPCSQNGGHGLWVARTARDGVLRMWVNLSDLSRTDVCFSTTFRFQDRDTIVNAAGLVSRRVR
jgi:hypothetical protein